MKKSGIIAASVAAASATAASASSSASFSFKTRNPLLQDEGTGKVKEESADKFAPRFDGLRFIETLVTGHR